MIFILVVVIGLVAWALHLMQEAIQHREFSLMLAGFLVSTAAAGMMAVYFLMGHYVGYMSEMAQHTYLEESYSPIEWSLLDEDVAGRDLETMSLSESFGRLDYRAN